jgi:hypothetical protein
MSSLMSTLSTVLLPLLDSVPETKDVKPGWIAFGVFALMALATVLLWLNMRKQIRKINFDDGSTPEATAPATKPEVSPNGTGPA